MQVQKQTTFNQIFLGSYKKVNQYARSLCRNNSDAEDVTQEAFIRAYTSLHTFDNRSCIDTWLIRIVRNLYFDSIRRSKRRVQTVSVETEFFDIAANEDKVSTTDKALSSMPEDLILFEAINQLDEPQRLILKMIVVEEKTQAEVAQSLEIPVKDVKSRYHRALKEARKKYRTITSVRKVEQMNMSMAGGLQ